MLRASLIFILCFVGLLFLRVDKGYAQEVDELENNYTQFWVDVTLGKPLNDRWSVGGDTGFRSTFGNSLWKLLYIRPNVNYKVKPFFDVTLGIATFLTFNNEFSNSYEFRIYQDANLKGPRLGPLNFLHRLRLEQRFFTFSDNSIENEFSYRGRYLIGFWSDQFRLLGGEQDWSAYVSLEPFLPLDNGLNELFASDFRWDTALSYQVSEKMRIELHVILQTSKLFSQDQLNSREGIFRFRVFQKL